MSLYQLEQVTQVYGRRTVLSIDHLEISQGKIYALHGPNGAGKTTLINILGFLDSPTTGRIHFEGKRVDFRKKQLQQFRRNVVVVSQRPVLFTTSVYKNMAFGLKIRGIPSVQRRTLINESLDLMGVHHLINAPAVNLSGGETQRVVLARALALAPRTIICDEPTASVDLESQVAVMDLLKKINREKNITIILSSHDRLQSTQLAHHTLFLDHGRLFDGAYENLFPVALIRVQGEHSVYSLDNTVRLHLKRKIHTAQRILLDPWRIEVSREPPEGANTMSCRVTQIIQEKESVRLVVNSSVQLVIMVSEKRYRTLQPMVGDMLNIRINEETVRVI